MREFTKTYFFHADNYQKTMRELHRCLMTFNARKFGRHLRGRVFLSNVDGRLFVSNVWQVRVTFAIDMNNHGHIYQLTNQNRIRAIGKFRQYNFTDWRKLLRSLNRKGSDEPTATRSAE